MNRIFVNTLAVMTVATALLAPRAAVAQNNQDGRIEMSYQLAFGRSAKTEEMNYWKGRSDARNWDVSRYVASHASFFAGSAGDVEVEKTIERAMKAAWGNQGSLGTTYSRYAKGKGTQWKTYVDIVKLLTADMDRDKKFKERVVIQAYADAGITPKSNDVWGWVNGFGNGKSYVQIVAEHYSWKARQSGGGGTAGLSPGPVGVEALRVPNAGIVALGGGNIVAVGGGNIIALGGANIVALGGGNFQALKAIPIVALGGGNLVGFNGRGF